MPEPLFPSGHHLFQRSDYFVNELAFRPELAQAPILGNTRERPLAKDALRHTFLTRAQRATILTVMPRSHSLKQTATRAVSAGLVFLVFAEATLVAGIGSKTTMYVGGTVASLQPATEGTSSTADENVFVFTYKGGKLQIHYDRINVLEYGQKAGRRLGLAIAVSPIALFSKKRKHFLTINYKDETDRQQAAVFELGKDVVRVTLATLEARTGNKIEYQDEEARKSGRGN